MKDDLRYKYKIKRKYFQHSAREVADGAIHDLFMQAFGSFSSFFIYNSFGSEADTHAIIDSLLSLGKNVCLPRTEGEGMVAVKYNKGDQLLKSALGVYEPQGMAYSGDIDVAIVPLLAVNGRGYRLGYGGGYYDKFLRGKDILKVGIGYFLQIADDFEEDDWDEQLNCYICERGIINFEH